MSLQKESEWKDEELMRGAIVRHTRFFLDVEPTPIFLNVLFGDIETLLSQAIQEAVEAERERMTVKNAGLYRQLFGEIEKDRVFTAVELWGILDGYSPLFSEEQKEMLKKCSPLFTFNNRFKPNKLKLHQ